VTGLLLAFIVVFAGGFLAGCCWTRAGHILAGILRDFDDHRDDAA
jgi:membrane protease YdiL (CAAX protease family)